MSVELEKYVVDRLCRAEKQLVTCNIEFMQAKSTIRELESVQTAMANEVRMLTTERDKAQAEVRSFQAAAKEAEPRLSELWKAADNVRQLLKAKIGKRRPSGDDGAALAWLGKALEAASLDCGEIPF